MTTANDLDSMPRYQLQALVNNLMAVAAVSELSPYQGLLLDGAEQRIRDLDAENERKRLERVRQEVAERAAADKARQEAAERWRNDPINEATERGWKAMKRLVPNLDGVGQFTDLAPALQHRYGEFARAVAGIAPSTDIVLSSKQEAGLTATPEQADGTGELTADADSYPLLETFAELDAALDKTIVMNDRGSVFQADAWRGGRRWWKLMGDSDTRFSQEFGAVLPVRVIWSPDVDS
ncbi:hypothetical protein [Prescottella agglutinans]|uniref:HNH endonuclease n=1 Tax=Prescottella agglutinans TaxID=1644129 RepID=A0ABT6MGJ4_9NOCA|nr:hypothetical protein [Prescottella agglutinans]MDH6282921.1 hypothetical protein [Prescottella agglutinans]